MFILHQHRRRTVHVAFTLVEIMFVIFVMSVLLTIAFPVWLRARTNTRSKNCRLNLTRIESAKEQWAIDSRARSTDTPTPADLYGPGKYVKQPPVCPSNGTYTEGDLLTDAVCSIGDNGTAGDTYDDHILVP